MWYLSPAPFHMGERNFSSSYSGKLVGLLEVNLTVLWDLLYLGAPGIFRVVQIELPAIHQLQFRFSRPALIPEVVSTTESLPVSLDSLHSPFSLDPSSTNFFLLSSWVSLFWIFHINHIIYSPLCLIYFTLVQCF